MCSFSASTVAILRQVAVTFGPALCIVVLLLPQLVLAEGGGIQFSLKSYIGGGDAPGECTRGICSAEDLLLTILNVFIVIATPIIVLFIIYAGFLYVTAQGNAQQVQQATRALTYAVIGAVLILGSVAIGEVIKGTVDAFRA